MLCLLSPQPPFSIHHRKQSTFQIVNNCNQPILFRFKNDQNLLVMPSFGLIQAGESKRISVTNKTSQFDEELILEAIQYVEDRLEMLEYSNPQLWIEKQPGLLQTQSLAIQLLVNTDASSTQQSEKKQQIFEEVVQHPQSLIRSDHTFNKPQEQLVQQNQPLQIHYRKSIDAQQEIQNSRGSNIFNPAISPILPQDASRLSANQSRATNEMKQPTFFTETYDIPVNDMMEQEEIRNQQDLSYQVDPQPSGNFKINDEERSYEGSNNRSQTSILKAEQSQLVQQLQLKEQQIIRQIEQMRLNKEQLGKELEQLKFKAMFKNKDNKQDQQIMIGHLLIVSVICLIMGALLKKMQQFF